MVDAAKQVNLDSMIEQLPEGYHTPVGYLGSLLSDGQKQLLAFGRTLIRKTPILLLDEATANIDSHTEKQIQASIENIRGSKTIVSIAHRLSTVQDANKIVYMEYGKIIEKDLLKNLSIQKVPFIISGVINKAGVSMEFIQSKDNKTIKHIIALGQRKNRQKKWGVYC